jgi:hypothetical protein
MSGCSLNEAFPDTAAESGKVARKEERKKAKACGGPALAFLKMSDDPDRQAARPMPPPEKMGKDGFQASPPEGQGLITDLVGERVDDVIGCQVARPPKAVQSTTQLPDSGTSIVPSYFGKANDNAFADYNAAPSNNQEYQLQKANFKGSFETLGIDKAAGSSMLSIPNLNNAWKPLMPTGTNTSFFEPLPANEEYSIVARGESFNRDEKTVLLKKLDVLFARLDDLENKKNEYAYAEVSLFILSGLFLMFGIETIRKMG